MTSIEWLINWMTKNQYFIGDDLLEAFYKAKEMHKQEIIDAVNAIDEYPALRNERITFGEQYYQETFVSKGNDEVELPKQETLYTEEQMVNAFKYAYLIGEDDISEDDAELEAKEYIQSLKQPKKN